MDFKNNLFIIFIIIVCILFYFKFRIDKIKKKLLIETFDSSSSINRVKIGINGYYRVDIEALRNLASLAKNFYKDPDTFVLPAKIVANSGSFSNDKIKVDTSGNLMLTGGIYTNDLSGTNYGIKTKDIHVNTIGIGDTNCNIKTQLNENGSVSFANGKVVIDADGTLNINNKLVIGTNILQLENPSDANSSFSFYNATGRCLHIRQDRNIYFDIISNWLSEIIKNGQIITIQETKDGGRYLTYVQNKTNGPAYFMPSYNKGEWEKFSITLVS